MHRVGDVLATLVVLIGRSGLSLVTSLALLAVAPALLGMTSTVVMSDSMAPGIVAGDVVVVRSIPTKDIHVGQVVLVDDPSFPGRLRLHRLALREHGELLLKGDANAQADPTPVATSAVHGVGFLRVPWVGLPLYWLRTGEPLLAVATIAAIAAAALIVALLDDTGGVAPIRLARRLGRLVLRSRRGRLVWFGLIGVVIAAPTVHAHLDLGPASWARFTSTSTSPNDVFGANSTFASSNCWAMPTPTPNIAYSFSAASGVAESSVGSLGSSASFNAVLSSASLRVGGTCASANGPSLQFAGTGSEAVVSTGTFAPNATGSQSIWFSPSVAKGVLFDLGSQNGTTATSTDRQLYFTSDGGLAFVMRNGTSPVSCTVTTAVTLNRWHFAAVTYDNTAKKFVVYYDGSSTSCTGTLTTAPSSTGVYGRTGSDATIASDASTGAYAGGIDEQYAWGSVLTPAQIDAVKASGH